MRSSCTARAWRLHRVPTAPKEKRNPKTTVYRLTLPRLAVSIFIGQHLQPALQRDSAVPYPCSLSGIREHGTRDSSPAAYFLPYADKKLAPQALTVPWRYRPCHRLHEVARVQRASILASVLFLFMILIQSLEALDRGAGRLQRHYGYTRRDGTNEHPGPSFPCSFRVVFRLIYSLCHGHTQNEPPIPPASATPGSRPRTRTSMPRWQRSRPQAAP